MFEANVNINAKDYYACSRYYLRKFLGVKEYILLAVLIIGGLVLFFAFDQWLILLLAGATVVIMAVAIIVYLALSCKGFKEEFTRRNSHEWRFKFGEEEFEVETMEENGDKPFTEKLRYDQVEKAAILKDRVYVYCGSALAFYIRYDSMTSGNFVEFCEFIKAKIAPEKFKMKDRRRRNKQFPYGR